MEYKKYKLGEIASFTQGKQVNINEQFFVKKEGMKRFVRIVDYTNSNEPIRYVKNFGKRYYVSSGEVAMIRYGSQTAGMAVLGKDGIIANNLFKILINNEIALNKYIFYFLSQKYIFNYLRKSQSSSTMPAISFNIMNNLEIYIPNKECQRKIVKILSDIDKKIESNNKINNNLQEISKQLYKRWFVDFEFPNEDGQPYKSSGGKMIDSELGEIPENWNVKTIDDLNLDISDGNYSSKYPTKSEFVDNGIPFIRGTDFIGTTISRTGLMFISEKKHSELKKGHLKKNDILITTRGEIGRIAYVPKKYIDANINAQLIRINGKTEFPKSFLGNFLLSFKTQQDINSLITGSALQQLPVGKFKQIKIVLPQDRNIIQKYNELTECYYEKIDELEDENEILTKLRDSLLPKLMNGEIELDNVEI